jgi:hypothetical protein
VNNCDWSVESFNDNDDFYALKHFSNGTLHNVMRVPHVQRGKGDNDYHTISERADVPEDDYSGISFLWLAYCSSCYFASVSDHKYKPVWLLDDHALRGEQFAMEGILTLMETGLPERLIYLSDGLMRARGPNGRIILRSPSPYNNGFTNAVYKVTASTNVGNLSLPSAFSFTRYGLTKAEGNVASLYVRSQINGNVENVFIPISASDMIPPLNGVTFVQDKRFAAEKLV